MLLNKGLKYNNENPRSEEIEKYPLLGGLMVRARAAHLNSLEMFPAFAAAVIIARVQKVDPAVLVPLCMRYVALRFLYVILYIFGVNKIIALLRTLTWSALLSLVMKIFFAGL